MEPQFKTSFIPKQPIESGGVKKTRRPIGLFSLIVLILFLLTVAVAAGLYVYSWLLTGTIERKKEQLEEKRADFSPALIEELKRLDRRIEGSKQLLGQHLALTEFFRELEQLTLKSVQFNALVFERLPDGTLLVKMKGVAESFASVALQANLFEGNQSFIEPVFENLDLNDQGDVVFEVVVQLDSRLVSYERVIEEFELEEETFTDDPFKDLEDLSADLLEGGSPGADEIIIDE